ncbi:hypothetical protein DYB36_013898 [Aphanomyces astaci]|uniref:Cysteine dioxygenase n=1 Tax=Aphanomyces astaci TaxID=112090 RepID=A0A396ZZL2_APHAT|nr:hypothetical protein DYB36_013898 [Aphanomyces astaci]
MISRSNVSRDGHMIVQDAPRPRDEHHTVKTTKSAQQAKPPPLPRKDLTLQELVEVIDMETQLKEGYFLASPIHDHPSDGCWIRHIQGIVNEVRYESDGEALVESANILISHGMTYMDDSLGLHKVGNPSEDVDAITLHLYAPPFYQCRLWHDPQDATNATIGHCRYDSEYGDY